MIICLKFGEIEAASLHPVTLKVCSKIIILLDH